MCRFVNPSRCVSSRLASFRLLSGVTRVNFVRGNLWRALLSSRSLPLPAASLALPFLLTATYGAPRRRHCRRRRRCWPTVARRHSTTECLRPSACTAEWRLYASPRRIITTTTEAADGRGQLCNENKQVHRRTSLLRWPPAY